MRNRSGADSIPGTQGHLAVVGRPTGTGELNFAIQDDKEALRLHPDLEPALQAREFIFNPKNEYARASEDLDNALKLNPRNPTARMNKWTSTSWPPPTTTG